MTTITEFLRWYRTYRRFRSPWAAARGAWTLTRTR